MRPCVLILFMALLTVLMTPVSAVPASFSQRVRRGRPRRTQVFPTATAGLDRDTAETKPVTNAANNVPASSPVEMATMATAPSATPTEVAAKRPDRVELVDHDPTRVATDPAEALCREHFAKFMHRHRRVYKSAELLQRYAQYRSNWQFVKNWNQAHAHATFKLDTNQFTDHTGAEFAKRMGFRSARRFASAAVVAKNAEVVKPAAVQTRQTSRFKQLPASKNWADDATVIGPVRMQGTCGSCWALATAAVVESHIAILTGETVVPASAQHLVDCCSGEEWAPCGGCNGGDIMTAYRFVAQNGLCAWDSYPYTAAGPEQCKASACSPVGAILGGRVVTSNGNEQPIAAALESGPVTIAIVASLATFQFYSSGVYNDAACPTDFASLDHAVVLTGYGTSSDGMAYWHIRNTWDTTWGENGYMRLIRGKNACGMASEVTQPIPTYPAASEVAARQQSSSAEFLRSQEQPLPSDADVERQTYDTAANVPERSIKEQNDGGGTSGTDFDGTEDA